MSFPQFHVQVQPCASRRGAPAFPRVVRPCQRQPQQSMLRPQFLGYPPRMFPRLRTRMTSWPAAFPVPESLVATLRQNSPVFSSSSSAGQVSPQRRRQILRRQPNRLRARDAAARINARQQPSLGFPLCPASCGSSRSSHLPLDQPESWLHFFSAVAAAWSETSCPKRACCRA